MSHTAILADADPELLSCNPARTRKDLLRHVSRLWGYRSHACGPLGVGEFGADHERDPHFSLRPDRKRRLTQSRHG